MDGSNQTFAELLRRTARCAIAQAAIVCGEVTGPTSSSMPCAAGLRPPPTVKLAGSDLAQIV